MRAAAAACAWLLLIATAVALISGCTTGRALTDGQRQRVETFDRYWTALHEQHPFFASEGVGWDELRLRYRPVATQAADGPDFYHALCAMLAELRDPHVSLDVPPEAMAPGGAGPTSLADLDGFDTYAIGEAVYVVSWPPGREPTRPVGLEDAPAAPVELVGLEGSRVSSKMLPLLPVLMQGCPGAKAEMVLRWDERLISRHVLRRPEVTARPEPREDALAAPELSQQQIDDFVMRVTTGRLTHERFDGVSVITIPTFEWEHASPEAFRKHIDALLEEAGESAGIVFDLRGNGGGTIDGVHWVVSRFLREPVDLLANARSWERLDLPHRSGWGRPSSLVLRIEPRAPRIDLPVVVLVDLRTGSGAEIMARIMQLDVGATVVGEQTIGAEAGRVAVEGADGSTLKFSGMRILDRRGGAIQGSGVVPDVNVSVSLEDLRDGRQGIEAARGRQMEAALETARGLARDRSATSTGPPPDN